MSKYNDDLKLKLAWQTAYEQRTCPPTDVLYAETVDDKLKKHLSVCENCRESREIQEDEKTAWQSMFDKMAETTIQVENGARKTEGQIWALKKTLGGWQEDGRYFSPPIVLLLDRTKTSSCWTAIQIFSDKRLMGEGDVSLNKCFGFAEGWNDYELNESALDQCLGCVSSNELEEVKALSSATVATPEDGSILYFFRTIEKEVAQFISFQAKPEKVEAPATAPLLEDAKESLLQKLVDWLSPMFSPGPLAAAVSLIVIISFAVINTQESFNTQIASTTSTTDQPQQDIQAKAASSYTPTLLANMDAVMSSRQLFSANSVEQQQFGFTGQLEPERAAFLSGSTFIDLVAAVNNDDPIAYNDTIRRLEPIVPILAGETILVLPIVKEGKEGVARFAGELEGAAARSGQLAVLQFGAWLQAARMADDEHLTSMIKPTTIEYFLKRLPTESLTPSVSSELDKLILNSNTSIKNIRSALDYINSIF